MIEAYWSRPPAELMAQLSTSPGGLSGAEAERRLAATGENGVAATADAGPLRLFLRQYQSPLVLILIFGAAVSFTLHEWTDALIILAIILGSTLLGFTQEYRASEAVIRLRNRLAITSQVLRDGRQVALPTRLIVPGDVVLLSAGNLVPADGIVLEARDFLVSQSALTGESYPVEKFATPTPAAATIGQRTNAVFLGTSVRSGAAKVLIVETGPATELAKIASDIANAAPETDFERGIRRFGYLLTRVMILIVLFVFTANLLQHRPLIDSLLFSVALAVGLTPELLPAIVSITLSAGARRMASRGVIVRRLQAIENLGSIDVLCTDKTGTLTKGAVELAATLDPAGVSSTHVMRLAGINASLETGIANVLDQAIVEGCRKQRLDLATLAKVDEIPYDFLRKRLTVVIRDPSAQGLDLLVCKGAFDNVLDCCTMVAAPAGPVPLDEIVKARLQDGYQTRGRDGFRVLAIASRRFPSRASYGRDDETGLVFEGFLLFSDPLKEGIADTIQALSRLGIAIKVISGDNRHIARHVADAVGLDTGQVVTGEDIAGMTREALGHIAETAAVFAEIDPQQKERIVAALQHRGRSVAYMGDGINDAPALHIADVGISVDQAVDVARETADIVLLERDLDVLRAGVIDGRRTFANTLKYVAITTSANFGNMISLGIGSLFVPFLPLLAKQILLNNFLSDVPSMAISTDNVDPQSTYAAQHWDIPRIQSFMVVFGLISTAFDLLTFLLLLNVFHADEATFQSTWFVVSLMTELGVVLVLRTMGPFWASRPSDLLLYTTLAVALAAPLLPYLDGAATLFGFTPIPLSLLASSMAVVALYVGATEIAKRWFFKT